ncbi:MAG: hypothetical protein HZA53_12220 [Planctomycetes bacterium]|nr:hypothetical protein [Planctomycetota bacterium]
MKAFLVLLAMLALAARTLAQEPRVPAAFRKSVPTIESVRASLASSEPIAIAWGARDAANRGWRECAPELRAALRALGANGKPLNEAQCQARDALVDALVRLDVALPNDELARWDRVERLRPALLALAALDPAACPLWLYSIAVSQTGATPLTEDGASASALLARGAPKLAAPLLVRRARPELRIVVRERWQLLLPDEERQRAGWKCANADPRPIRERRVLPDFPPLILYHFVRARAEGVRPVTDAPIEFGLVRTEVATIPLPLPPLHSPSERFDDALRILAWLVRDDPPPELDLLQGRPEIALGWSTPERFLAEARERCDRMEHRWRALVEALAKRGLLDAAERELALQPLRVVVFDERRTSTAPLPALPPR